MYDLIYYCDSYPAIGNGHLKRCIDIIEYIIESTPAFSITIMGHFSESANKFLNMINKYRLPVLSPFEKGVNAKVAILDTLAAPGDVDTIDKKKSDYLKSISNKLFVFNTGYKTQVINSVDAIINYIPITHYTGNLDFEKYFGLDFAPVSSAFFNNSDHLEIEFDVLAIIGGGDEQYGPRIIAKALNNYKNKTYGIIVSPHFPKDQYDLLIKQYPQIRFFRNVPHIKDFISRTKTVICTYGNTTYESMAMQKPTFVVAYFDFQYRFAEYLEKEGMVVNLGYLKALNNVPEEIFNDQSLTKLSENCSHKFKTSGIENIGKAIIRSVNDL